MEIQVGKTSGFCYGVKNAVNKTKEEVEKRKNRQLYCLGELVHNKTVIKELEKSGVEFIENLDEAKENVIVRAHGIEKHIYDEAKKKNINLIDLTCPSVLKIHRIAEEYSSNGYYIFLVGKKEHPETIGTYSFCGENSRVISKIDEIEDTIKEFEKTNIKKLLIIVQTTFSVKLFNDIVKKVKENISNEVQIEAKNTICPSTELRQEETKKISKNVDLMIIVGGKNSSNTNKLYDISSENCKNVIFAENKEDIDIEKIKRFNKIGIMAGASTPQESVDEIIRLIENKH